MIEKNLEGAVIRGVDMLPLLIQDMSRLLALREAAVGIRRLTEALERDPEMLIKGKGKAGP